MAKKRQVKTSRLILVIFGSILAALIVVAGVYGISRLISDIIDDDNSNNSEQNVEPVKPTEDVSTNDIEIIKGDYKVYEDDTDKLGFNFLVAELTFKAENSINFDLNKLQTSEKINLGDVDKYLNKLTDNGYNISKLNITSKIQSQENKYTCYVFIPYTTDSITLGVYNLIDTSRIDYDLTKNVNVVTSLKVETEEEIVIDETSISVLGSYEADMMFHNDEQYPLAGNVRVYAFSLNINSVDAKTNVIESAQFIPDGSGNTYKALDEGYKDSSFDNVINKELHEGDRYALYFEIYSANDVSYDGKLIVRFKNNDKLVELSTTMQ